MWKLKFIKNLGLTLLVIYSMHTNGYAQKSKSEVIHRILSDTLNDYFYLIPIKFIIKTDTTIWLTYKNPDEMYQYFKKKYGWNRVSFISKMSKILLLEKCIKVDSDSFEELEWRIPFYECNCIYNENSNKLKQHLDNHDYYRYPDKRFICLVYKCFKNNVILGWDEAKLFYDR